MNAPLVEWLTQIFKAVPDVKNAHTEVEGMTIYAIHNADLVVDTWMGTRLHVHLVTKPPKLRDLKGLLKDNSARNVGTLFVVAPELLPSPAQSVKIEDWQEGLWALNDGWIYSYHLQEGTPSLIQVQMSPTPIAQVYHVWHMTDFAIENVVVQRRDFYHAMKGSWYVADIASVSYKRKVHYERQSQRFHYSTKYTHRPENQRSSSDKLAAYYAMIGVKADASEREIKSAFRRLALQYHPDVSPLPRPEAERLIKELLEAYDAIKDHHGWT